MCSSAISLQNLQEEIFYLLQNFHPVMADVRDNILNGVDAVFAQAIQQRGVAFNAGNSSIITSRHVVATAGLMGDFPCFQIHLPHHQLYSYVTQGAVIQRLPENLLKILYAVPPCFAVIEQRNGTRCADRNSAQFFRMNVEKAMNKMSSAGIPKQQKPAEVIFQQRAASSIIASSTVIVNILLDDVLKAMGVAVA